MSGIKSCLLCLLALVALVACDGNNDKIGSTVKGTRVPVVEEAKAVQADKDVASNKPTLPPMMVNMSWPQTGYDASHAQPYAEMSPHPKQLWQTSIGDGSDSDFKLLAHPVADRTTIYTMDAQGLVRAIDAKSGDVKWEYDTTPKHSDEKAISGGLAVDGNTVFATTGFGDVVALDTAKGGVKWRKSLLKPLRAAPTVADNRVYVLSIDNELNVLDAVNGNILWHQVGVAESATLMGASSPAIDGDTAIVAYNSGEIFGLRVQNGRTSWSYSLASPAAVGALPAIADIRGLPVIDRGRIYAISHSGRIAAVEQRNGERVWESDIGGIDTPIVAGDAVFVYGGESQLMALARDSGRVLWIVTLPKQVDLKDKDSDRITWTGPLLAGERLWMVNSQGKLASFSPADGAKIDSFDLDSPLYLSPIIVDHTMYVLTDEGKLIALK